MSVLSGISNFFGLDIGTDAIRLVELHGSGPVRSLVKYAYVPVPSTVLLSDAKGDKQKVAQAIADLVTQAKLGTKNVAVGLPSRQVFSTVVDFDRLSPQETAKAIKYQADALIPTPLETSKMDWAIIGDSPKDATKVEVLISSVDNTFIEDRLDILEGIGLNVIAFEPNSLALTRALVPHDSILPQLVLDIGEKSTDLVIVAGGAPWLIRSIQLGNEAFMRAAAQNLNVTEDQAAQFVYKFGLTQDKLEGRVYQSIINQVDTLVNEIDKSIKFFQLRYNDAKLDRIIVAGGASAIPNFPIYLANKFGLNVEIGNAWRNVSFAQERQSELLAVSNHFSVAVGLAERNV